jgi:predicted ATPase/class 3 adenylate cyclase/tetratricopeptide (TPR) repeat protein
VEPRVFLLTDLVNSSSKWSREPEAMSHDLKLHDQLLTVAIERHQGKIIKHTGDGYLCVFNTLSSGIEAAKEIQHELEQQNWQTAGGLSARIAVVHGEAQEREGDFFGTTLNLLSRLCAALGPRQVALISRVEQPESQGLRNLGVHSYRGIDGAFRVFEVDLQLQRESSRRLMPKLNPKQPPQKTTTFVGRVEELNGIRKHLADYSITTLVGPGGIGKSRLASEIASQCQNLDGVAWIPLGVNVSDEPLHSQIWRHLSSDAPPSVNILKDLTSILEGADLLIVLDSVDEWRDEVAELIPILTENSTGVQFLLTSRAPLGCPGEVVIPIYPLQTKHSGLELFVNRAKSARGAALSPEDVKSAIRLVDIVDGIPLAIEIIASRCASMPIQQIQQLILDHDAVLQSGQRGRIDRHKTLESAFDWTFKDLDESSRITFCGASLFLGSFSLDSLCDLLLPLLARTQVVDATSRLVEQSMIQIREGEFIVLDTLRAYGNLKSRLFEFESKLNSAFLEWAVRLAESSKLLLRGSEASNVTILLEKRRVELRAAAETFIQLDQFDRAATIVAVLWRMWYRRGEITTGLHSLEPLWKRLASGQDLEVRRAYGWALYLSGRLVDAEAVAHTCLADARKSERGFDEAQSLNLLAGICSAQGHHSEALAHYQRSFELAESKSLDIDVLRLRLNAASALLQLGRYDEALAEFQSCRIGFKKISDVFAEAWTLLNLGITFIQLHKFVEAEEALTQCRAHREKLDDHRGLVYSAFGLSLLECARGNLDWAKDYAEEGCLAAIQLQDSFAIGAGLVLQTRIALLEKDFSLVARILPSLEGHPPGARYASSQDDISVLKSAFEALPVVLSEIELAEAREFSESSSQSELLGSILNSRI